MFDNDVHNKIIIYVLCQVMVDKTKQNLKKKYNLLLMCIVIKFIYFKKITRYYFFYFIFILSIEINNIIINLVIKLGLT
jgi:hypothetical protein